MRLRRTLPRLRVPAAAVLAVALTGAMTTVAAPAQAVTEHGYDISWPQCPSTFPPTTPTIDFVVIGLTHGLAFTENQCVAAQHTWAATNGIPTHAYAFANWPTSAELATHGDDGPWTTATLSGRLHNVGYAGGTAAAATLQRIGRRPPVVWVDVELRDARPWPTPANVTTRARNRWLVEGTLRALSDAGYATGVYSVTSHWAAIVGSWWLPGVPTWVSAGPTNEAAALAKCSEPSWSGGPVHLSQWWDSAPDPPPFFDHDVSCPPYRYAPPKPPAPSVSNDVNGDWKDDLLAREGATGKLWLYRGTGSPTGNVFQPRLVSGASGWNGMNLIETPGDLTGDGRVDLLARDPSGTLWLYPGRGGGWGARVSIGTGWQVMASVAGGGDLTGDGRPDVVARDSGGTLWLYPGTGASAFGPRSALRTGWQIFDRVIGAGDMTLDGIPDVLARKTSTGQLFLYPGTAGGGLGTARAFGSGWNSMALLTAPGDLDANGAPDLVARSSAASGGQLWLYPGKGDGTFGPRRQIGTGWSVMTAIA